MQMAHTSSIPAVDDLLLRPNSDSGDQKERGWEHVRGALHDLCLRDARWQREHPGRLLGPRSVDPYVASSESEHEMKRRVLLHIVVGEGATVFQLLPGKDQTLLIGRDAFLVLDLGLDNVNRVGRFDLECDGLSRESFDKDLHVMMICNVYFFGDSSPR